jgi:Flp pilus assembly protein TadD
LFVIDEAFHVRERLMTNTGLRLRLLMAAVGCVVCCGAAWYAARVGVSRLFAETATRLRATEYEGEATRMVEMALRLSPSDPEAHYARAAVAAAAKEGGEGALAVGELERATALEPRYYLTWLRLGRARERVGDVDGAVAAYGEAARLAPFYAAPRWQAGNTLLRAGRRGEAFEALRRAAASRPSLFLYTVELAWRAYDGDARAVAEAVSPQNASARVALARFFVKHGRTTDALAQFRAARNETTDEERQALIADLIAAGRYTEAREVWSEKGAGGALIDGGFEDKARDEGAGFGWRFARGVAGASVSLDVSEPRAGAHSLRFEFGGTPDASVRLASQLVAVEPLARYRLRFAARTDELLSGGMPLVAVLDAGAGVVASSTAIEPGTRGWKDYEVEFVAPETTGAVVLVIKRQSCAQTPCPIYGRVWFDDFALEKLSSNQPLVKR